MNTYLLALVGLIAILAVGAVFYGWLFKQVLGDSHAAPKLIRLVLSVVGMYLVAWSFILLFRDTHFLSGASSLAKGLELGSLVGLGFFVLPLLIDAPYFKANASVSYALALNWLVSFMVLGLLVGQFA